MLTARQKSIFDYILSFRRRNGCSPSIPEIQKAFGIRSPNGVAGHLDALEAKGVIHRAKRGSRQIDIAGPLASLRSPCCDLPLFDRFSARAKPSGCVSIDEKTLGFRPQDGCFALKVRGDSMRADGILAGDLVVVDPAGRPAAGRIVVAEIEGRAVVQRLTRYSMGPGFAGCVRGVVRAVIRRVAQTRAVKA